MNSNIDELIKEAQKDLGILEREKFQYDKQLHNISSVIGALVIKLVQVDHQCTKNGLMGAIYNMASDKDKLKLVKSGLIDADKKRHNNYNKESCISEMKVALKTIRPILGAVDIQQLELIKKQYINPSFNKKVYGRINNFFIYIKNKEQYISDELAVFLCMKENFS